ncbi:uncharacterized protein LOC141849157 [Brevipalpus obovatus]|uniref:uncharacterized protein LOC141849157 n=1 Tax=Brevipalpus obovatus TaxID=246614 RepID=UPI003D9FAC0B
MFISSTVNSDFGDNQIKCLSVSGCDVRTMFPLDPVTKCTKQNCSCEIFSPGKGLFLRNCNSCNHEWLFHVLDQLRPSNSNIINDNGKCEDIQANSGYDVASLVLYGTNALPVRLKILLDKMFSGLTEKDTKRILSIFGWTPEDYSRGYKTQDHDGKPLSRWNIVNREEEILVLQQFLRFAQTKTIAQHFLLNDTSIPWNELTTNITAGTTSSSSPSTSNSTVTSNNTSVTAATSVAANLLGCGLASGIMNNNNSNPLGTTSGSAPSPLNRLTNMKPFDFRCNSNNRRSSSPTVNSTGGGGSVRMKSGNPNEMIIDSTTPSSTSPAAAATAAAVAMGLLPGGLSCRTDDIARSLHHSLSLVSPKDSVASSGGSTSGRDSYYRSSSLNSTHRQRFTRDDCDEEMRQRRRPSSLSGGANSETSGSDSEDDSTNMSESVINLSQSAGYNHHDLSSNSKGRHLRKPNNPMRMKRLNTNVLSTMTMNPSTGKKRVQCNACKKTFCDKGALKIHYSAVHLREMHPCTVPGCKMKFSSRRSRNRHSANPNPKLHTPNMRRKINPHDGRSANPYPHMGSAGLSPSTVIDYTGSVEGNPSSGLMGGPLSGSNSYHSSNLLYDSERNNMDSSQMTSSSSVYTGDGKDGQSLEMSPISSRDCGSPETDEMDRNSVVLQLTNKSRHNTSGSMDERTGNTIGEVDDGRKNKSNKSVENDGGQGEATESGEGDESGGGINLSTRSSSENNVIKRKRKNLNPIKCEPSMVGASDDDLQESCNDSSSGTYIGRMEDHELPDDDSIKSEDDEADDGDYDSTDEMRTHDKLRKRKLNKQRMDGGNFGHNQPAEEDDENGVSSMQDEENIESERRHRHHHRRHHHQMLNNRFNDKEERRRNSQDFRATEGTMDLSKKTSSSNSYSINMMMKTEDRKSSSNFNEPQPISGNGSINNRQDQISSPLSAHKSNEPTLKHSIERNVLESKNVPSLTMGHRVPSFLSSGAGMENLVSDPLRHLESLTKGNFGGLAPPNAGNPLTGSLFGGHPTLPFPHHPGFPFGPHGLGSLTGLNASAATSSFLAKQEDSGRPRSGNSEIESNRSSVKSHQNSSSLINNIANTLSNSAAAANNSSSNNNLNNNDKESSRSDSRSSYTNNYGDGGHGQSTMNSLTSPVYQDASGSVKIPVDKDNPRKCVTCGKIFQNHFGVKTHYQNVHLKLMHKCTVDGCNAAFPSKRSRDRHSSNMNLHRKLLSTHPERNGTPFGLDRPANPLFPFPPTGANIRDDLISRFYDPSFNLNLSDLYPGRVPPMADNALLAAMASSMAAAANMPFNPAAFNLLRPHQPTESSHHSNTDHRSGGRDSVEGPTSNGGNVGPIGLSLISSGHHGDNEVSESRGSSPKSIPSPQSSHASRQSEMLPG